MKSNFAEVAGQWVAKIREALKTSEHVAIAFNVPLGDYSPPPRVTIQISKQWFERRGNPEALVKLLEHTARSCPFRYVGPVPD